MSKPDLTAAIRAWRELSGWDPAETVDQRIARLETELRLVKAARVVNRKRRP